MRDYSINLPEEEPEPEKKEEYRDKTPMGITKEVENDPSQKGTLETTIWGVPVDLQSLEGYIQKISPYTIRTLVRNDRALTMERIKNYSPKRHSSFPWWLIVVIVIMLVGGLLALMFGPQIMQSMQGMAP